jgi:hypothetical protein
LGLAVVVGGAEGAVAATDVVVAGAVVVAVVVGTVVAVRTVDATLCVVTGAGGRTALGRAVDPQEAVRPTKTAKLAKLRAARIGEQYCPP